MSFKDIPISFILTSVRDSNFINETIKAVYKNCEGNFEIVFSSERTYTDIDERVTYLKTEYNTSVENYNNACKHATHDWICVLTDDLHLTKDPREFIDNCEHTQVFNLHYNKHIHKLGHITGPAVYIPMLHKKIINEQLDGNIFSAAFKHHFVDLWLGVYLTLKIPNFKIIDSPCVEDCSPAINKEHDKHDQELWEEIKKNVTKKDPYYTYNGLWKLTY